MGEGHNRQRDASGAISFQLRPTFFRAAADRHMCHHGVAHLARRGLAIPPRPGLAHASHLILKAVAGDQVGIKRPHATDIVGQMGLHQPPRRFYILRDT